MRQKINDTGDIVYSAEVREIIGKVPPWILRFGTILLLLAITLVVWAGWMIKLPEVLDVPFTFVPAVPTQQLNTGADGTITRVLVGDGQPVKKGQVLADFCNRAVGDTPQHWRSIYPITAPFEGTILFLSPLHDQQDVPAGFALFSLTPAPAGLAGQVKIPANDLGQVKIGQDVLLEFNGYPYRQFGYVQGRITSVSGTPGPDGAFVAGVALPGGLQTSLHRRLPWHGDMTATAEIITRDVRLLERFWRH